MADNEQLTQLRESLSEGEDPAKALDQAVGSDRVDETTQLSARDIRQKVQNRDEGDDVNEGAEEVNSALEEMGGTDLSSTDDAGKFHELLKVPLFDESDPANDFQDALNDFVSDYASENLDD